MSGRHLITFKAGCFTSQEDDTATKRTLKPDPTPGYIIMYEEDEMIHFSWRKRTNLQGEADLDLVIIRDARFVPYTKAKHKGRIFVLKFTSGPARHFFWLQSRSQSRDGDASFLSERDRRIGKAVDMLCQGEVEEVDDEVREIQASRPGGDGDGDGDGDTLMEDVDDGSATTEQPGGGSTEGGNAGSDDKPGQSDRSGGAANGHSASSAAQNMESIVQNFVNAMQSGVASGFGMPRQEAHTTLPDLLSTSTTLPAVQNLPIPRVDALLRKLPPTLLLHAFEGSTEEFIKEASEEDAWAMLDVLEDGQKREILRKVLLSPQFSQSLASLTMAIRDGGLPSIGEALGLRLADGGYLSQSGSQIPKGGGDAMRTFVEGYNIEAEDDDAAPRRD